MRIGIGWDLHRLKPQPDGAVPLGGVSLPCEFRVEAHSDGDVVLHALVDACLGALALGDIGEKYPDTDSAFAGRSSEHFLRETLAELASRGWKVAQIDTIIQAETPKIGPHRDAIRQNLGRLVNLELTQVSIKAKTLEGLGPIGEKRAIAAHVAVTLEQMRN